MNYFLLINAFYDRLEEKPLSASEIALWHALANIANKAGWPTSFTRAISALSVKTGLNSKAIERARNKLQQLGYIKWKARGGSASAVYELMCLYDEKPVAQSVAQDVAQPVAQSVSINKQEHKQKEYSAFFEEVWKLYPNKKGKDRVSATQKKKLVAIGYESLAKCIKRYTADKPDWQAYQNGSTFFNSGYVDYLDENYTKPEAEISKWKNFN